MKKAIILLSGGIDSTTTLAIAKEMGYKNYALTIDYKQRHKREVESARKIARYYKVKEHKIIEVDLAKIGGSALVDMSLSIPVGRSLGEIGMGIPVTYVPARNTILLSLALAWAEVVGASAIFIGANSVDYSGYPDCRREYFMAFQRVMDLGTKSGVEGHPIKIVVPLIEMSKVEIIQTGMGLGVPFGLTWSCYEGGDKACGKCDSCILRLKGFKEAGLKDPIEYEDMGDG